MTQLVQTISKVKKYINQDIKIDGMIADTSISLSQSVICSKSSFMGQPSVYPNSPDSSGTSVVPIRATPPPATSCFMPWDFTDVR